MTINADLQQVNAAIARIDQEVRRFGKAREQLTRSVISAAHHQLLTLQWSSLQEALTQLKLQLKSLEARRSEQQKRLIHAIRDRETVSELRQQYTQRADEEETRSERKRIDEIFSARRVHTLAGAQSSDGEKQLRKANVSGFSSQSCAKSGGNLDSPAISGFGNLLA